MRRETIEIVEREPLSDKDLRKLLLKFVLSDGQDSVPAFTAWERLVVFDDLSFQSFKLLSAVYPKLLELDITSRLFFRIKGAHRRTWTENQLLLKHLEGLFADLNTHRINFIVADEAFRLAEIYNDLGIYSLQNFQVVAPIRQKKEFCTQLIEDLWEICDDGLYRTHCKKEKTLGIDILWASDEKFDDQSREAGTALVGNSRVPIIRVEEQLLNLCENRFLIQGDEESGWQFIAGALFKAGKIDSSKLIELARRRQLTHEAAKMIDGLAAHFDVKVPADLLVQLRKTRRPGRILLAGQRLHQLRNDYRIYLTHESGSGTKPGFIEFLERRWRVDSHRDLIKQGVRSCIRLLQAR